MKIICVLVIFLQLLSICMQKEVNPPLKEAQLSPSRDNPAFNRDRKKNLINKPDMPTLWLEKHHQPFNPAWMDYCDPSHCNDYHKIACGLNRRKMKFKWFQSSCHIIMNNYCAHYRGTIKYDKIDTKYCYAYVMYLRLGLNCPEECPDVVEPICGMSSVDGHTVIFKNSCLMEAANCKNETIQEYEQVYMEICQYSLVKSLRLN